MTELKSLVLTRFRPDSTAGGAAIRNRQNIDCLSRLGPVDVFVIGPQETKSIPKSVNRVQHFKLTNNKSKAIQNRSILSKIASLISQKHPLLVNHHTPEVTNWLQKNKEDEMYDICVIEELALAHYISDIRKYSHHVVFDAHNVECHLRKAIRSKREEKKTSIWKTVKRGLENQKLISEEKRAAQSADSVWACSTLDATTLTHSFNLPRNAIVVPNAIDPSQYESVSRIAPDKDWSAYPLTITYLGSYSYYPNADAAITLINQIFPIVQSHSKDAKLVLVGRDPTSEMTSAAAGKPNIHITGEVPEVRPFLDAASILCFPIKLGSGTRLKILEGFASKRPIVSSIKGAEGIDALDGEHIHLRDDAEEISKAIIELWNDKVLRSKLCKSAHELVCSKYSIDYIANIIATNTKSIARNTPARPN